MAAQEGTAGSTLEFYRAALAARRSVLAGLGSDVEMLSPPALGDDVLAFTRDGVTVVLNAGSTSVPLPAGEVVIASGPVSTELPAGHGRLAALTRRRSDPQACPSRGRSGG